MKKNKTNLIFIVSVLLLMCTLGFLIYFLNIIKNKNKHISAVASTLENKLIEKENITSLKNKINELSDANKNINSYFVDTSNIDTFVEYLENIGINNNVDLSVSSVEVPKNEKNKILASLIIKGDFPNIMKVVAILESAPYNIVINSLYLNKDIILPNDVNNLLYKENKNSWQANVTFNVLSL